MLVVVAVMIVAGAFRGDGNRDNVTPAGNPLQITIVKPTATSPFDRTFDWNEVRGATSYRVAIFTSDGQRSFEVRDLTGTSVALSPAVKLAPGRYSWQVTALRDGQAIAESPLTAFDLK